tara:strand:+ start:48 stop:341 length:294 start_codon:yes stop_codon:yes gene_type:complete
MKTNNQLPIIQEHQVKTQMDSVLWHLQTHGCITSWEAIREYGATRLSAIIYNLRHNRGYNIGGEDKIKITRFGRKTTITNYLYNEIEPKNYNQTELF